MFIFRIFIVVYRWLGLCKPFRRLLNSMAYQILLPAIECLARFKTIKSDPLWFRFALILGYYEKDSLKHLQHLVNEGMIVLDIGAHVGYYSQILSQLVKSAGKVISFEPNPDNFKLLVENTRRYKNVTTFQVALANKSGVMKLYDSHIESGSSSLVPHTGRLSHVNSKIEDTLSLHKMPSRNNEYDIKVHKADEFLRCIDINKVDFAKIDIEGAEVLLLEGMEEVISNSPGITIMIEYAPTNLIDFGFTGKELISKLKSFGFNHITAISSAGMLDIDDKIFTDLDANLSENYSQINLLCRKMESID